MQHRHFPKCVLLAGGILYLDCTAHLGGAGVSIKYMQDDRGRDSILEQREGEARSTDAVINVAAKGVPGSAALESQVMPGRHRRLFQRPDRAESRSRWCVDRPSRLPRCFGRWYQLYCGEPGKGGHGSSTCMSGGKPPERVTGGWTSSWTGEWAVWTWKIPGVNLEQRSKGHLLFFK